MNRFQLEENLNFPTVVSDLIHDYASGPSDVKVKKQKDIHLGRWPHWVQYSVINRNYTVSPDLLIVIMIHPENSISFRLSLGVNSKRELYEMYDMGFHLENDGKGGYIWSE